VQLNLIVALVIAIAAAAGCGNLVVRPDDGPLAATSKVLVRIPLAIATLYGSEIDIKCSGGVYTPEGCRRAWANYSAALERPSNTTQGPPGASSFTKLMIFGGRGHHTYLGCLNCAADALDSIWNTSGPFGTCPLGGDSLYCRVVSQFGSSMFGVNFSACASGASDPPVIVDHGGNYYGRFSIADGFSEHRDSVCNRAMSRYQSKAACDAVKAVCDA
jgi:hypothetical protein